MEVQPEQMASLTSGKRIFSQLDKMISKNQAINSVILGPEATTDLFTTVFPDIVESNSVGKITADTWSHWKPGNNEVTLEEDPRDLNQILDNRQGAVPGCKVHGSPFVLAFGLNTSTCFLQKVPDYRQIVILD